MTEFFINCVTKVDHKIFMHWDSIEKKQWTTVQYNNMNEYPKQNIGKKKPINKVHNDKSFIKRSERDKTNLQC